MAKVNNIEIISVEDYKEYQSNIENMGITDEELTDCIRTATDDLSALTKHLIIDVYVYMSGTEEIIETNSLYRNAIQMDELYRAVLAQTHYRLNNGNDNSVGDASYNGAGISASYSNPERNYINNTVYQHLLNAKLILIDGANINKAVNEIKKHCQNDGDFLSKNSYFDLMNYFFSQTYVPKKWTNFVPNKFLSVNDAGLVVLTDAPKSGGTSTDEELRNANIILRDNDGTLGNLQQAMNDDPDDIDHKLITKEVASKLVDIETTRAEGNETILDNKINEETTRAEGVEATKQDKLTAGANITISDDNVISAVADITDVNVDTLIKDWTTPTAGVNDTNWEVFLTSLIPQGTNLEDYRYEVKPTLNETDGFFNMEYDPIQKYLIMTNGVHKTNTYIIENDLLQYTNIHYITVDLTDNNQNRLLLTFNFIDFSNEPFTDINDMTNLDFSYGLKPVNGVYGSLSSNSFNSIITLDNFTNIITFKYLDRTNGNLVVGSFNIASLTSQTINDNVYPFKKTFYTDISQYYSLDVSEYLMLSFLDDITNSPIKIWISSEENNNPPYSEDFVGQVRVWKKAMI